MGVATFLSRIGGLLREQIFAYLFGAGNATDACRHGLDRHHQRIAEQLSPEHGVPELRADLRIRGDTAGIVVRRAGDQARAELLKRRAAVGFFLDGVHGAGPEARWV